MCHSDVRKDGFLRLYTFALAPEVTFAHFYETLIENSAMRQGFDQIVKHGEDSPVQENK